MSTSSYINEARVYDPDDRSGSWSYEESEHGEHALGLQHAGGVAGRCRCGRVQAPFHVATLDPRPPSLLQSLPVKQPARRAALQPRPHTHTTAHTASILVQNGFRPSPTRSRPTQ